MKYYIVREDYNGTKWYKKNKTVDGWTSENYKPYCWRFSKQGAKKICDRMNEGQTTIQNVRYKSKYYYLPAE
jgi:hypothetical protein